MAKNNKYYYNLTEATQRIYLSKQDKINNSIEEIVRRPCSCDRFTKCSRLIQIWL